MVSLNEKIQTLSKLSTLLIREEGGKITVSVDACSVKDLKLSKEFNKARLKAPPKVRVQLPNSKLYTLPPDALDLDPKYNARYQQLATSAKDFSSAIDQLYTMATRKGVIVQKSFEDVPVWGDSYHASYIVLRLKERNGKKDWVQESKKRSKIILAL